MESLLLMMSSTWMDASNLANDNFDVRQRAEARLDRVWPLSLPAVLWASRQPDLEQRRRAGRLWRPMASPIQDVGITLLAVWLFYGPSDWPEQGDSCWRERRWLRNNLRWAAGAPDWLHLRLRDEAIRLRLLSPGASISHYERKSGWIDVCRHRAYGREVAY